MADEMLRRSEFLEYMKTFEERLTTRFDQRMDRLEQGQDRLEQRQTALEQGQHRVEQRQTALEQGQQRVEQRQGGLEERQSRLEQRMDIQFEETRSLIRLSLEGVDALRETTERGFADVRSDIYQNKTLLEAALKQVR